MATFQELARDGSEGPDDRSQVAWMLVDLGPVLYQAGRPLEAEAEFREALATWQKMADDHPNYSECRDGMASGQSGLSDLLRRLGRTAEARDAAQRAVALREALVRENSDSPTAPRGLASSLHSRAMARLDLGETAGAAADARRALALYDALSSRSGEEWFETARCQAVLAGLAGQAGAGLSAAQAPRQADAAMALLHKAVRMGYRNAGTFRTEAALDPLRDRDDFRLLMMDLVFPADPFAKDTDAGRQRA
jgi:tetratricopeptide (TPR) repeat protein